MVVRGDWANVAKKTQEKIPELVPKQRSSTNAADFVRTFIPNMRGRRVPYRDLVEWKTLTKPAGRYKVNAAHVQAARILKKEGWALTVGDKVGYVIPSSSRTKQVAPVALRILINVRC